MKCLLSAREDNLIVEQKQNMRCENTVGRNLLSSSKWQIRIKWLFKCILGCQRRPRAFSKVQSPTEKLQDRNSLSERFRLQPSSSRFTAHSAVNRRCQIFWASFVLFVTYMDSFAGGKGLVKVGLMQFRGLFVFCSIIHEEKVQVIKPCRREERKQCVNTGFDGIDWATWKLLPLLRRWSCCLVKRLVLHFFSLFLGSAVAHRWLRGAVKLQAEVILHFSQLHVCTRLTDAFHLY